MNMKKTILISWLMLFAITISAKDKDKGHDKGKSFGSACFVQYGATGNGRSATSPYGSLAEVENNSHCKSIFVLPGEKSLDGGIVLKNGQKLIGVKIPGRNKANHSGSLSSITNTIVVKDTNFPDKDNALPVVTLANHNTVKNLHLIAKGSAIFGDNVSGSKIENVLVTKDISYSQNQVDSRYCQLVRDANGNVINADSILRGCHPLSHIFRFSDDSFPQWVAAIQLFFGDGNSNKYFENSLSNVVIDGDKSGALWQWGINLSASSKVKAVLNLRNTQIKNVSRAYSPQAFGQANVTVNAKHIVASDNTDDGFIYVTGFLCSGLAGENSGASGPCPSIPMPVSENPKMTVYIDKSQFIGNGSFGQGIELTSFDQGKADEQMHVSNTTITGYSFGVFVWDPNGYPRTQISDLGCLNLNSENGINRSSCIKAGYTSLGKNLIYGNDSWKIYYESYYTPGSELLLQAESNIVAQNNYWGFDIFKDYLAAQYPGRFTDGRITELFEGKRRCQEEYDNTGTYTPVADLAPYLSPPVRCSINQGPQLTRGPTGINGKIDDAFPLLTPPRNHSKE